ncbi:hypothetical protein [Tunturiibacter gelidiferens]|uniref:hypothetical protein n=1 Tax=Tunturiibacter gelidiferens TaxID=3069689 RepID=UPI003D9B99BE
MVRLEPDGEPGGGTEGEALGKRQATCDPGGYGEDIWKEQDGEKMLALAEVVLANAALGVEDCKGDKG